MANDKEHIEFIKILWWFLKNRGLKETYKRFQLGVWGFTHTQCMFCGRPKERNCGSRCEYCERKAQRELLDTIEKIKEENGS
jgi:hypothetical protein